MGLVLGVCVTAGVVSGKGIVEVSDGRTRTSNDMPGLLRSGHDSVGDSVLMEMPTLFGAQSRISTLLSPLRSQEALDGDVVGRCESGSQGLVASLEASFRVHSLYLLGNECGSGNALVDGGAIDARSLPDCDDCGLYLARADLARMAEPELASERVAAAEVAQSALDAGDQGLAPQTGNALGSGMEGWGVGDSATPEGEIDGEQGIADTAHAEETAGMGELWLISHYTAGANYGNTTYPYGSPTASGLPAEPGVVACGPGYLGMGVQIAGWNMLCADTGNPAYVYDGVADIWCEEAPGFWGPTDPQYAGEWWYGLPCPAPCEVEIEGRCYARVEIVR